MSSAPQYPGGTTTPNGPKKPRNRMEAVADFATRAAQTSAQQTLNLGATRPGIAKMIAVAGAGVLLVGGGIFAYNSMHQEENAFLSQGEEYARVCQDAKTGLRVEDSECEKAGVQEPTDSPSASSTESSSSSGSSGSSSSSGSSGSSGTSGSTTTHNNSNAFLWYYLGRQSAANSSGSHYIPPVGSKLSGGSTTRPSNGTVYSGVSSKGGGFEDSYRTAKKSSTVSSGKVTGTSNSGKTSSVRNKTTGSVSSGKQGTSNSGSTGSYSKSNTSKSGSSSKSGSRGGFGGGSKSGGGTSGG